VAVGVDGVESSVGAALAFGVETTGSGSDVLAGEQPAANNAVTKGRASRERRDNSNHFLNRFQEGSNLHTDARPG
jgi:hypothetical protein